MKLVKTTKRFINDFPSGITMLNIVNDRYYYFDKTRSGKIASGMFWNWKSEIDFPANHYTFIFDRVTKETFLITI